LPLRPAGPIRQADSVSPSPSESDISNIEDPEVRKAMRLKKRKKQIEAILKAVLAVGGLFSISIAIGLSIIANKIEEFPWNNALGSIIIAAWSQICYFLIVFLYQQFQQKALYFSFLIITVCNIVVLSILDFLVLNNVIQNYQNQLPPNESYAYDEMGAPVFGGTIFYLLFIGIVAAVVIRHFEIKHKAL